MKKIHTTIAHVIAIAAILLVGAANAEDYPKPTFTADGKLNRPDISYREWIFVGTPLTPNDMNPPEATFPGSRLGVKPGCPGPPPARERRRATISDRVRSADP